MANERPRILVVDDEAEMAEMLAERLIDRGYHAVAVSSGCEANARMERESFDLLLTDLRMRPVDGIAVLTRSRVLDPSRPVIIMTAYGALGTAVEAMRQGAFHYLVKPFAFDDLAALIARALAGEAAAPRA